MIPSIFKAYDIRGVYNTDWDKNDAYFIGRAFGEVVPGKTVCIGMDMRLSSIEVKEFLIKGLRESGKDIIDIDLVSTDMVTFAVGKFGYDAGIMITASHNPGQYNGLKMCAREAKPISPDYLMPQIKEKALKGEFSKSIVFKETSFEKRDIWKDWVSHVFSFVDKDSIKPFKIVIDAGNGMAGKLIPYFEKELPQLTIERLYFELDGSFPNHEANPLEEKNQKDMREKVLELGYDMGLAFDGDADRVFFCDEVGNGVSGTEVTAMIADTMLFRNPEESIVYNAICGRIVPEVANKYNARSYRFKVGHSFLKAKMKETGSIFAGEHSGHYFFRDNYCADSAIIATVIVLELLSKKGCMLSRLVKEYKKYVSSGEINSRVEDIPGKLNEIKDKFSDAKSIDTLDGISVWYDTVWFNVRPSNTEPLLRLNVEGDTKEITDNMTKRVLEIISST